MLSQQLTCTLQIMQSMRDNTAETMSQVRAHTQGPQEVTVLCITHVRMHLVPKPVLL